MTSVIDVVIDVDRRCQKSLNENNACSRRGKTNRLRPLSGCQVEADSVDKSTKLEKIKSQDWIGWLIPLTPDILRCCRSARARLTSNSDKNLHTLSLL